VTAGAMQAALIAAFEFWPERVSARRCDTCRYTARQKEDRGAARQNGSLSA
jgi:hypothetical protein